MSSDKRNSAIDIYKGIGIVLMLMGHVGFGDIFSHIVHAFHMPMFFFISGFLYNDKKETNIKGWIGRKSKTLLYPYLLFGVMNYIVYVLIWILRKETITLSPLGHLFFVNTTGLMSGSLWFLTALFISNVLFYVINCIIKRIWMKHLLVILISFTGIFVVQYLPFRLPYAIDAGMVGTGMQYVGYLMRKQIENKVIKHIFNLSFVETSVSAFVFSILFLLNGEINMRKGFYHNILFFGLNAVAGSVLIYNIAIHLNNLRKSRLLFIKYGIKTVERIGMNSLIYVCMNDIFVTEIKKILTILFIGESKIITLLIHVTTLIVTIGIIDLIIHYTPVAVWLNGLKKVSVMKETDNV